MAAQLLHELRVPFIVAPYEADAQLGYLYRRGVVDLVVSEDSDCLVYGCGLVLYKFAIEGGGDLIALEDVLHDKRSPFHKFTTDMVRPGGRASHRILRLPDPVPRMRSLWTRASLWGATMRPHCAASAPRPPFATPSATAASTRCGPRCLSRCGRSHPSRGPARRWSTRGARK